MWGYPVLLLSLSQTPPPGTYLPLVQSFSATSNSWAAGLGSDLSRIPSRVPVTAPCPIIHRTYKHPRRQGRGANLQYWTAAVPDWPPTYLYPPPFLIWTYEERRATRHSFSDYNWPQTSTPSTTPLLSQCPCNPPYLSRGGPSLHNLSNPVLPHT